MNYSQDDSDRHGHRVADKPGLEQEELGEAAREGPHGSHEDTRPIAAEEGRAAHGRITNATTTAVTTIMA